MTSREALDELRNDISNRALMFSDEKIDIIEKDLEVLEILKKQIIVIESKSTTDFGNYITSYGLDITLDGLDFIQFNKIKRWLQHDK